MERRWVSFNSGKLFLFSVIYIYIYIYSAFIDITIDGYSVACDGWYSGNQDHSRY